MKWYSIEEYMPPSSMECLIFTENNCVYVARLESKNTPRVWIHDYDCNSCESSSHEEIFGVTHFALIETIPINNKL